MYAGHFASALAIKAKEPRAPTWALLLGVGFLDVLFGIFLGLWRRLPTGWWWVELAFIAAGCAYYVVRARTAKTFGGRALWACAVIVALHLFNSPWLSPAK